MPLRNSRPSRCRGCNSFEALENTQQVDLSIKRWVWTIDMIFRWWLKHGIRITDVSNNHFQEWSISVVWLRCSLGRIYNSPSGVHQSPHSVNLQLSPGAADMGIFGCSMWGGISSRSDMSVHGINMSMFDCACMCLKIRTTNLKIKTTKSAEWLSCQAEAFGHGKPPADPKVAAFLKDL